MIGAVFIGADAGAAPWGSLCALGLLTALLSLDDTALAQTWFSQPLPAGILAGAFGGDPLTGLALGLPCQLIVIGNLPVGRTFTGEQVAAVVATVGGAILAGVRFQQPVMAAAMPGAGQLGWLMVCVVLLSSAGHWVVQAERRAHFVWMLAGHRSLRDGQLQRVERLHGRCLAATALRGFVLGVLWLILVVDLWLPLFALLPERLVTALSLLPVLAPAIGVGVLVERYGWRACWRRTAPAAVVALVLGVLVF